VITDWTYPQDGKSPDPGMVYAIGNLAYFGHSATFYDYPPEAETAPFLPRDLPLLRELFSLRRGSGEPLIRGHMLWESMTWEPGEPMEPSELVDQRRSDPDYSHTLRRETRRRYKASLRKRRRRPTAGNGGSRKRSAAERKIHLRALAHLALRRDGLL
jgi:hypothetical protein